MNNGITIPCLTTPQTGDLIHAAHQTALRFCSPVFLVGSATESTTPIDIDIFIVPAEEIFLRLFTNFGKASESESDNTANYLSMELQQARLYKKQKEFFYDKVKAWDFDVKFDLAKNFYQHDGKKLRLDYKYTSIW